MRNLKLTGAVLAAVAMAPGAPTLISAWWHQGWRWQAELPAPPVDGWHGAELDGFGWEGRAAVIDAAPPVIPTPSVVVDTALSFCPTKLASTKLRGGDPCED
ncbi:hypothetical protein [Rhodopila sp.]|uniref:hypothetical protein n=1 Tax=Rhodopila sp. TaxID=2480087 RepID=UPI003D1013EB